MRKSSAVLPCSLHAQISRFTGERLGRLDQPVDPDDASLSTKMGAAGFGSAGMGEDGRQGNMEPRAGGDEPALSGECSSA